MEGIRQKRYKIASDAHQSPGERFSPVKRGSRGNKEVEKQRNSPILASDSSSCSSGAAEEASFTLELGWRSSKEAFAAPVKRLLADEMSKENGIKKRSPGVIAKLMGLDGMPSPRSAYNQQKCSSEDYSQRCISKEKAERKSIYYDGQISRRSSKDQQEFKDVFEVLETSKMEQSKNSEQETAKFEMTQAEMSFIQQKFVDVKRFSTDEKSYDSREFHDALDVLESNRDLLLKFLDQPGSLFTRHLQDLRDAGSHSGHGWVAAMKSSDNTQCEYSEFRDASERGTPRRNNGKSKYYQRDGHSCHSDSMFFGRSLMSSQILQSTDELEHLPTKIVVLKPNIGELQNATTITFPTHSLQEFSDPRKFRTVESRNKEYRGKKKSVDKEVLSGHGYIESRDTNGITRQMKNGFNLPPTNLTCSGFQGYAGDESSCSLSGNESGGESMVRTVNLKSSSNLNKGYRRSSSRHKESSISREAKKRLTDRWKLTRSSEDNGVVSRGSTLADMLAAHDKEVVITNVNALITEEGFTDKFSNYEQRARGVEPIGISSNDGWKDESSQSPGPRSLPASTIGFGSPKTMHLISKESKRGNKSTNGNFDQRECILRQKSKSSKEKLEFLLPTFRESSGMLQKIQVNQNRPKVNFLDDNSSEMTSTDFDESFSSADYRSPNHLILEDEPDAYTISFPEPSDDLHLELSNYASTISNSCSGHPENLIPEEGPSEESPVPSHKSLAALGSPDSSKDANQPSPVSVLEPTFRDDVSSCSECFESISADLQGLRMQPQLLKFESEPHMEGLMLISSDEDAGQGSLRLPEENWELSYLVDILNETGLNHAKLQMSDRPISPTIFDKLEKRHSHRTSTTRANRRLLFDRINAGIVVIGRQVSDPHPWVMPAKTRIAAKWMVKDGLQISLCKYLETQKKEIDRDDMVEEGKWQDLEDEIDGVGKEIERMIIYELLDEIIHNVI